MGHGEKSVFTFFEVKKSHFRSKKAILGHTLSVSVYYVAVRTIVLSRHGSNLARPDIIHDIIHGLMYSIIKNLKKLASL